MKIILIFCVLSGFTSASYQNASILASFNPSLVRRWYSVPALTNDGSQVAGGWGPWSIMCPGPDQTQPVRYCFADQRSATNLQSIVDKAVAMWAHAMQVSTLEIGLDDENSPVCGEEVRADALVISDVTKDSDDEYNWEVAETKSTVGYNYASEDRGRHTLEFSHYIPGSEADTEATAVRAMAHELGHVIGLQHEHQRSDRGKSIYFKCKYLEGYADAEKAVDIDEQALFEDDTDHKDRMNLVCNDATFANAYLPSALPFIRGEYMEGDRWQYLVASSEFDFNSIMIYNSNSGSSDPTNAKAYVLVQKDNKTPVWMGGSQDPAQAQISPGDVARVAQLYPKPDGGSTAAMNADQWGQEALRVRIRGEFEAVVGPLKGVEREL